MERALSVLVVDDDETIGEMVVWALSDAGYEVRTAPNGAVALDVLETLQPDLILLDMRMPVMDGWQFAKAFRERAPRRPVPLVVMTAAQDAARRASEIAANGYLAKPFTIAELLATAARYHNGGDKAEPSPRGEGSRG